MSFETYIGKNAAFKVTDLYLQVTGIGKIPVSRFQMSMQVNGPNTCVIMPCIGRDRLNRKTVNPNIIEKISPKDVCSLYMNVKTSGSVSGRESLIFQGRLTASDLAISNNPLGSKAGINLSLRHLPEADLMGVSIAQRSYYVSDADYKIFRINKQYNGVTDDTAFRTPELMSGQFAVYLKQLCDALVKWYMNNNGEVDIQSILRAVPCYVSPEILKQMKNTVNSGSNASVPEGFAKTVKFAFDGAVASKATLMSILASLSSFAMLSLVPTLRTLIITPTMEIARWTKDTGIYLSRKWIQGVDNPSNPLRFPIERVSLNRKFVQAWLGQDIEIAQPSHLFNQQAYYSYPETGVGSVLLVDPPPILSGVINTCSHTRSILDIPKPLDKGGSSNTNVNSAGGVPMIVDHNFLTDVAKRTARLMWSKLAYAHHSSSISVIPHWIFSDSYAKDIHATYDKNSIWSVINKNIKFKMPFTSTGYGDSDNDIAYVGYVKGMSMEASVEDAHIGCTLNVTNVRTAYEDQQFALPLDANPLYDNTTANPV